MRYKGVGILIFMLVIFSLISAFSLADTIIPSTHPVCCSATDSEGGGSCEWITNNNSCRNPDYPNNIWYPMGPSPPCPSWVQGNNILYADPWTAYSPIETTNNLWSNCMWGCSGPTPNRCSASYGDICTNLLTDSDNCGQCGVECSSPTAVCQSGSCVGGGGGGGDDEQCMIGEVSMTPLTCDGNVCSSGDKITVTYSYTGALCFNAGYRLIYINGTYDNCHVEFAAAPGDINGIYSETSVNAFPDNNPGSLVDTSSFVYTIPFVGSNCVGKTVSRWRLSGDDNYPPSADSDNIFEFFTSSITFGTECGNGIVEDGEDCDDGSSLNYGFWNPWDINTNRRCLENCQLNLCYIN